MKIKNVNRAATPAVLAARITAAAITEGNSRADVIAAVIAGLGKPLCDILRRTAGVDTDAAKQERAAALRSPRALQMRLAYVAPRMALAMPSNRTLDERIGAAIVAINDKAGATGTAKLKKGQSRRTAAEEKAYGNAREYWSKVLSEAGLSGAKTNADKNKAKRTAKPAAKPAAQPAAPVKAVKLGKVKDKESFIDYAMNQAAALLASSNKNAAIVPGPVADAIMAFHSAMTAASAAAK